MSTPSKNDLINAIGFAISRWQDSVEDFDGAVGEIYELSAVERRCLGSVTHGPRPANVIAKDTGLTPAAVTTLIDRLERRGFVRRQPDPSDRRKVLVVATDKTRKVTMEAYHPVFEAGAALLDRYSVPELRLIHGFIEDVEKMQNEQTDRLRSAAGQHRRDDDDR